MKKADSIPPAFPQETFYQILNGLKAGIYVTDMETDEILFMNDLMKKDYNLEHPEGKICWQVLQAGQTERCSFCPVERLKKSQDKKFVCQWDEIDTINHKSYRNYDSLITWGDGRTVHLQQSIDVSELKSANTDELTQFLTRRSGKEALNALLEQAAKEDFTVTACLYDINHLKEVNDQFGHAEGDNLLVAVSDAVRSALKESEFAFRLSGDEFVIAFQCGQKQAQKRMKQIGEAAKKQHCGYDISFCFGLVEALPELKLTVDEILFLADRRMYEQKRLHHIEANQRRLNRSPARKAPVNFEYNTELLYDALNQSTDDYIYVCNMKTGVFKYPRTMVEEFDLPGEIIENAAAVWGSRVHQDDQLAFLEANQEISDGRSTFHCVEYRAQNRKGEWVWVRCRGHLEVDKNGEPVLFAGFITNLGKKNKIDNLTGLFNKLEFSEQLRHLISTGQSFSLMLLGIDDLRHINDLYDRAFGDEVIRITSQKLQSLLPENANIYRMDGDEFAVIVREADREVMEGYYKTVYHSFESQQSYDKKKYYCTISGGCLFYPADASGYESVIKYASYCLEYSKRRGKKQCTYFFKDILDQRAYALELVELLRESVENDDKGFSLVYQPIMEAGSGKLVGVETLARWKCEKYGSIPPLEFIPLLESTGLIVSAGKWILRQALSVSRKWVEMKSDFVVNVNLSYIQIQDDTFLSYVRRLLTEEQFPPGNLALELTESHFIKESDRVWKILNEFRGMGVSIAIDDFGTGYSTLGILKESPADIVKIDKTFIKDINNSSFDSTFIRFVVELCHTVGIAVCLEGVETSDVYDIVSSMGLDMIQGYLFDKPMEEEAFTRKYFEKLKNG